MSEKKFPPEFARPEQDKVEGGKRELTRRDFVKIAGAAGAAAAGAVGLPAVLGAGPAKLDPPTLSCSAVTKNTVELGVCAGASGAAAGFSVQWMTCDDLAANGGVWYASDDPRLCKASFSGNANGTSWNLAPGACVDVVIGGLNDTDPGVSFTCNEPLECETCYVFRAFAHNVPRGPNKSDFSANWQCTTEACEEELLQDGDFCTKSQGYFGTPGTGPGGTTAPNNGAWTADQCALTALGGTATIGDTTGRSASWSTVAAIVAYLPGGGPAGPLTGTTSNTSPSGGGSLAAQTLALTLNVALSGSGCTAGTCAEVGYPGGYGAVKLCNFNEGDTFANDGTPISAATAADLNDETVSSVLAAANAYLGNGGVVPFGLGNAADLGELVASLNLAFDLKDWNDDQIDDCACGGMTAFAESHLCPPAE